MMKELEPIAWKVGFQTPGGDIGHMLVWNRGCIPVSVGCDAKPLYETSGDAVEAMRAACVNLCDQIAKDWLSAGQYEKAEAATYCGYAMRNLE